jgi:hypothetical protein
LLREVFDYDYQEIADIVGKSEANVRQLLVRARRHIKDRRQHFEASRRQREELARRFFAAMQGSCGKNRRKPPNVLPKFSTFGVLGEQPSSVWMPSTDRSLPSFNKTGE